MTNFDKKEIPQEISIFPLDNAVFFPNTILPLNIFEPRYKKMIEDALASNNKMIGMIQTRETVNPKKPEVFSVGCLGKIDTHTKTADGRYLINLKGLVRFRILDEAETELPYRKFRVTYDEFLDDLEKIKFNDKIDVLQLIDKARKLFKIHHLSTDWKIVEKVEPDQLINSLSMICPFSVSEKQGLLEAKTLLERNLLINQIINFYIIGNNPGSGRQIH
jgi:Lon protease-like protein